MSIAENIAHIRQEIDAAARETGRTGKDITLVGASKMNDAARCREAIAAGIDALGENRVQEMTEKLKDNAYDGAPLHFIGHLQRNKVKQVVGKAALIQSAGGQHRRRGGKIRFCPGRAGPGGGLCQGIGPCPGAGPDDDTTRCGGKRRQHTIF